MKIARVTKATYGTVNDVTAPTVAEINAMTDITPYLAPRPPEPETPPVDASPVT